MQALSETVGEWLQSFVGEVGGYLPSLVGALAVLIIGWLVALLVSRLVRAGLKRTSIDNKIAGWVRSEGESVPDIERVVGRLVFWLLMIFVFVAFFQILGLSAITGPLDSFLDEIFQYAPNVLSACFLLVVAWLVASGVRLVLRTALRGLRIDERVGSEVADVPTSGDAEGESGAPVALSSMLSETAYWLVFLLFLPMILDALQLEGLLSPIREMVGKLLGFLPNLFAAAIIFLIGWFIARIVQRLVTNLLGAVGIDSVGEKAGIDKVLGRQRLSGLIGLVVYALILLPVLISALNALQLEAITRPASGMLDRMLSSLPALFGAGLVLVIAYIVGRIVAGLVSNLLRAAGFDRLLEKIGLRWTSSETTDKSASDFAGRLLLVVILLFAAVEALNLLGFSSLAALVTAFIVFLGNVLLGLVIFALGLYLADFASQAIRAGRGDKGSLLASAAYVAIVVLASAMALRQMDVAEDIINLAFGLVLGAAAVAAAIAFGVGGRDLARAQLEGWLHRDGDSSASSSTSSDVLGSTPD